MSIRTNYQTVLTIDTATPISEGKMRPDGGDIRIYEDAAQTTPLDFYIDPTTLNTTATKIYIKQDLPTGRYHPGAIAYYPLDGSGTDIIGGFNGTLTNSPTTIPGPIDNALNFVSASSQYVQLSDSIANEFDSKGAATFECWFRRTTVSAAMTLFAVVGSASFTKFRVDFSAGNLIQVRARSISGDSFNGVATTSAFTDTSNWHHLAASIDIANSTGKIWIDGVSQTVSGSPSYSTTTFLDGTTSTQQRLADNGFGLEYFNGDLDNCAVYLRELTDEEVRSSYLRGLAGKRLQEPTPSAYWTFNSSDNAGSEVVDLISGLNGTINGTVTVGQSGRVGQSFLFDGSTGYIEMADSSLMEPHIGGSGQSTWVATVNWNGATSSWLSKYRGDTNQREFYIEVFSSGEIRFHYGTLTNSARGVIHSTVGVPTGKNVHIAVTYDATLSGTAFVDKVGMFIDGVRVPVYTFVADIGSFTAMSSGTEPLRIGKWIDLTGTDQSFFDGKISDVLWSNSVLTDAQIAELARRSKEGLRPDLTDTNLDLLAYWSFDNKDIGITPEDTQAAGHSWTANNTPLVGQPGIIGEAVKGDGSTTSYRGPNATPNAFFYPETGDATLSLWMKRDGVPSATEWIYCSAIEFRESGIRINATGTASTRWQQNEALSAVSKTVTGTRNVCDGEWHHLCAVIDRTSETLYFYIDGTLEGSNATLSGWEANVPTVSTNHRRAIMQLWSNQGGGEDLYHFEGWVSDVWWLKGEALTAEQVREQYEKGRAGARAESSTKRIYVTYGDTSKTSASNASTTFVREITGLTHAYKFDEATGGNVLDSSGTENGTIDGYVFVRNGITGLAREMEGDGAIDFLDQIIPLNDTSILLRFSTTSISQTLFSNYDGDANNIGSSLEIDSSGFLNFRNSVGAGSDNALATGTTAVDDGVLHSVIVVKSSADINVFLDGYNLEATDVMTSVETASSTSNFKIGAYSDGTSPASALFDEICVFNKVLNQNEITDLMNNYAEPAGSRAQIRKRNDPEPVLNTSL